VTNPSRIALLLAVISPLLFALLTGQGRSQAPAAETGLPARHYTEGEKLTYHMKGDNDGWTYDVQANGVVKKNSAGHFIEEYGWSDFKSNAPMSLSPETLAFRQNLSLDPDAPPSIPDLSKVQPFLIGPITDLLTFYADLWLANKQRLNQVGDHVYVKHGTPASWADGTYVILGESSIDFDLTLKEVDPAGQFATLLAKHVPPAQPEARLPAEWMRAPVADTPNNWVNVEKSRAGKFVAAVGKETFDVEIKVSLKDGKILSATLENLVRTRQRDCSDAAYQNCGEPADHTIHRHIELMSVP
jgi:hypothetical protein